VGVVWGIIEVVYSWNMGFQVDFIAGFSLVFFFGFFSSLSFGFSLFEFHPCL